MVYGLRDGNEMGYVAMVTTNASDIPCQKESTIHVINTAEDAAMF